MTERPRPDRPQGGRGRAIAAELANLSITVATRRDEDGETLLRELQRTRAQVRHLWPVPERLPEDTDVLYCDLAPGLPDRIPWVPGEPKAALVVMIPRTPPPDLELLTNSSPDAVLHKPFAPSAVVTSLLMARHQFLYEQRLRGRIEKLDETLRTMRSVERAKAILMSTRSMREDEAYHFLRRQAMVRRVPISAVAAAIVDTHEIFS
ncbi:MAG TPA: ANTAR domain-containing protein [Azospirillum sp.]|nr:ANTAR domain-containing protein [Azospirillum sp.]